MVKRILLGLWVFFGVVPAWALMTKPLNIEEMISVADRIFLGKVMDTRPEITPGKPPAMVTRFSVLESYKGQMGSELTLRQLARKGPQGRLVLMVGLPKFNEGETVVVFLTGESSLGLASPLGMEQGLFRVRGKETNPSRMSLMNGHGNRKLFSNVEHESTKALARRTKTTPGKSGNEALLLSDLRQLIQVHLRESK